MDIREIIERQLTFQNRQIYSLPVHYKLWDEDLASHEEACRVIRFKQENQQLLVQKTNKMLRNVFKTTDLESETEWLIYGSFYQLRAADIPNVETTCLTASLNVNDVEVYQHFIDGTGVFASSVLRPCVRNTFKFVGHLTPKTGQSVRYGDLIYIQICEQDPCSPELFLRCCPYNPTNLGQPLVVGLSANPDVCARFKLLHWNPRKRVETIGTTVVPNVRLIVQHVSTGMNLAVEPGCMVPTLTESVRVVSCHTYRDSHRMETGENFWKIVTQPRTDYKAFKLAALGHQAVEDFEIN